MKTLDVYGLYGESWQGEIVPDAFAHPAKFSRALIRWIYQHCLEEEYIKPGDRIVDPFGGVALGGLDAMRNGLHWHGVELEQKFVDLGNQNIKLWNQRYAQWFREWGTAQLIQGDSRRLGELVAGAQACVGSPPYATINPAANSASVDLEKQYNTYMAAGGGKSFEKFKAQQERHMEGYGSGSENLANLPMGSVSAAITSPPFGEGETRNRSNHQDGAVSDMMTRAYTQDRQGTTEGNLATLKADTEGYAAAIGSPPYTGDALGHDAGCVRLDDKEDRRRQEDGASRRPAYGVAGGQLGAMKEGNLDAAISSPPYADAVSGSGEGPGARHDPIHHKGSNSFKKSSDAEYGNTPGNLGNMAASIGSPPFESQTPVQDVEFYQKWCRQNGRDPKASRIGGKFDYGSTDGNIGNDAGETFWQAAKTIVEQVYMVLKPGGHCVWVCKDFVRSGKRVEFSNQWQALCEACGFVPVEWIRAWVIEERGTQGNLFTGEFETKTIERKSFFRRLAERKGSPRIDWEDVLILRKPL